MKQNSPVVTRIAPSPTGRLHVGTARTALFNYLFAKHFGGTFVLRSEDTDRTRSKKEFEEEIFEGLHWLGIKEDVFVRQSERVLRHRELLEKIIAEGKAYVSREPARDEEKPREVEVVRLKNPGRSLSFHDEIRGDITFDTTELGNFVIAKSLDEPLYHFAVVVDDADAGITHVIRGEDHVSNTPRQILIQEALGVARPVYAHLPIILDERRAKLSKRSGATSLMDYRAEGFLPEAIVNYLALLGWSPGTDDEFFSLPELASLFSLDRVQKGGGIFDRTKLLSVNQHWMRQLSDEAYLSHLNTDFTRSNLVKIVPLLKERAKTFGEAREMLEGELGCFFKEPEIVKEKLVAKEPADHPDMTKEALKSLVEPINALPEDVSPEVVKDTLMPLADAEEAKGKGGRGAILWPLRYALSGQERSPDPFTLISILGSAESISRIKKAIELLK